MFAVCVSLETDNKPSGHVVCLEKFFSGSLESVQDTDRTAINWFKCVNHLRAEIVVSGVKFGPQVTTTQSILLLLFFNSQR